ncbi:AP2/ERF family transcription factor [Beduini massiliensis]|uniref:hypothetical protein n=1 Tax=Beduini massiliensis TaxID=1585974 RepID=UPI00059AB3B7|nr:hypothetical protein [Beduini massiliensis]
MKSQTDRYQGKRFGKLTVLSSYRDHKGYWKCVCQCDCGQQKEVYASNLVSGRTRSCGCMEEANRKKYVDLTNQRFGMLKAICPTQQRKKGCVVWKCQCDCGNICYITSRNLIRGDTKSCGCLRSLNNDLTGKQFGKLHAIKVVGKSHGHLLWLCQCECGNQCIVQDGNLKSGHTQSCGCVRVNPNLIEGTNLCLIGSDKLSKRNTSGVKGVSPTRNGRWVATITFKGKRYFLGQFTTISEAETARKEGEEKYFAPFLIKHRKYNLKQ